MKNVNILGVDVSKDHLDICLLQDGKVTCQVKIKNTLKEISRNVKLLSRQGVEMGSAVFCMEHTGVYNNILLGYIAKNGYQAWVESARQIILSGGMTRGKSDKVDAMRIALYAHRNLERAKFWKPKRSNLEKLAALLKSRKRMVKVKNQLAVALKEDKKFVPKEVAAINERVNRGPLKALIAAIDKVDLEIKNLIKADEIFSHQSALIKSVPGVGEIIAATTIVKTNEFIDFTDPRRYACQAGVAPFDHLSGSSIRGRSKVSHMADKTLKTLLHLAAMAAIRKKGELQDYYLRKVNEVKNKMCVLNAIRNKIVQRIFAVINRGTPYQIFNNFDLV